MLKISLCFINIKVYIQGSLCTCGLLLQLQPNVLSKILSQNPQKALGCGANGTEAVTVCRRLAKRAGRGPPSLPGTCDLRWARVAHLQGECSCVHFSTDTLYSRATVPQLPRTDSQIFPS